MPTSPVISSRLLCRASEYNFAASSRNLPNNAARASLSAASRWARTCECCVVHEVANEVRPPMALPASAAKADMYAASIGLARCGSLVQIVSLASRTGIPRILGSCEATIARSGSLGNRTPMSSKEPHPGFDPPAQGRTRRASHRPHQRSERRRPDLLPAKHLFRLFRLFRCAKACGRNAHSIGGGHQPRSHKSRSEFRTVFGGSGSIVGIGYAGFGTRIKVSAQASAARRGGCRTPAGDAIADPADGPADLVHGNAMLRFARISRQPLASNSIQ